jgi:quercetin dioxygenase-like cupin family protein
MENQKKELLNGKALIITLPIFASPAESYKENLKRLMLEKGELSQIYNSEEPVHHIAYLEYPANSIRGGHYHPEREEKIYIIGGEMILAVEDLESEKIEKCQIEEGDIVIISPKTAHAIKTVEAGQAIEFSSQIFKPEETINHMSIMNAFKE